MITPKDPLFGAVGDGIADDTAALNLFFAALASGQRGLGDIGATYLFSQLTIPPGCVFDFSGSVLRSDGSMTASDPCTVYIGDNCKIPYLEITTPGTESNNHVVEMGANISIGTLSVKADVQRGSGGVLTPGQDVRIDKLITFNLDRPFIFYNTSTTAQTTGSVIGLLDVTNYVRAFRADFCSFRVDKIFARGRSQNAGKLPGHNGVLIAGCANWSMGDLWIEDAGEHAFRVGGSGGTHAVTKNFYINSINAVRPGGCAFKINPTQLTAPGVTEKCSSFRVGKIVGVDVGDGVIDGNSDLLRLTHVNQGWIGSAVALTEQAATSGHHGLIINDCDEMYIGELGGTALAASFIIMDSSSDCDGVNTFGSSVRDLRIGRLFGRCAGINSIGVYVGFRVGGVTISGLDINGPTGDLVRWNSGNLIEKFHISGRILSSAAPTYWGIGTHTNFRADIQW
jgi:hypothetical protein